MLASRKHQPLRIPTNPDLVGRLAVPSENALHHLRQIHLTSRRRRWNVDRLTDLESVIGHTGTVCDANRDIRFAEQLDACGIQERINSLNNRIAANAHAALHVLNNDCLGFPAQNHAATNQTTSKIGNEGVSTSESPTTADDIKGGKD